jgi:hypothetical protein
MEKLNFSELDAHQKRLVFWLADKAGTLTPTILAAASLPGELWEAKAFLKHFPRDSEEHAQLVSRLRLGGTSSESILAVIEHVAPTYQTIGQRCALESAYLLPESENFSMGL